MQERFQNWKSRNLLWLTPGIGFPARLNRLFAKCGLAAASIRDITAATRIVVFAALMIAVFAGCKRPAGTVRYDTTPVSRGKIMAYVTASGSLSAVVSVDVGCQVSGQINKLYVDYNSTVTNGELLAQIDPRNYEAMAKQAAAQLANSRANLELQQAQIARDTQMFTNKLISGSDYDTAVATLHEAEATVIIKQGGAGQRPGQSRLLQNHRAGGRHRDLAQGGRGPDGDRRHEHAGAVHHCRRTSPR